ncbi:MAG: response regulator, partial [Deltaproteobacteria bacterium]|nr:response regulator [Deltaproteobacteria bacterium]
MVDLYQMQQVFINIINNAEDAMVAHSGRGRLEVGTRTNKGRIEITFRDDGPGIPREVVHKVFDPFFTTKEVGKGTGLGLSITHGIITEHGGAIGISCPDSGGTLVTIELPVVDKEVWADVRKAVDNAESKTPAKGQRVLIADDEKNIRDALSDILVKKGFTVNIARDGQEAIGLLERMRFALLITDIRMPGISGMELY